MRKHKIFILLFIIFLLVTLGQSQSSLDTLYRYGGSINCQFIQDNGEISQKYEINIEENWSCWEPLPTTHLTFFAIYTIDASNYIHSQNYTKFIFSNFTPLIFPEYNCQIGATPCITRDSFSKEVTIPPHTKPMFILTQKCC